MAVYHFEGMDGSGSEVTGNVDAANEADAQRELRERGYFVTRLQLVGGESVQQETRASLTVHCTPTQKTDKPGFFFPFERFVIRTDLSPDEVRQKVSDAIETRSLRSIYYGRKTAYPSHKPYRGIVQEDKFRIRQILDTMGRKGPPMRIVVEGRICREMDGTVLHLTLMPDILSRVLFLFLLGFLAFAFFTELLSRIFSTGKLPVHSVEDLLPAGVTVLVYVVFTREFKDKAGGEKSSLRELFNAYQD